MSGQGLPGSVERQRARKSSTIGILVKKKNGVVKFGGKQIQIEFAAIMEFGGVSKLCEIFREICSQSDRIWKHESRGRMNKNKNNNRGIIGVDAWSSEGKGRFN